MEYRTRVADRIVCLTGSMSILRLQYCRRFRGATRGLGRAALAGEIEKFSVGQLNCQATCDARGGDPVFGSANCSGSTG